jgi:hypothetical protein
MQEHQTTVLQNIGQFWCLLFLPIARDLTELPLRIWFADRSDM